MSAAVQEFDRATRQLRLTREREAREWATLSARLAAKYSADQPRVPAGNPEGGQWTGDGGSRNRAVGSGRVRIAADISGFKKHGINQTINRGVGPAAIRDAVKNRSG